MTGKTVLECLQRTSCKYTQQTLRKCCVWHQSRELEWNGIDKNKEHVERIPIFSPAKEGIPALFQMWLATNCKLHLISPWTCLRRWLQPIEWKRIAAVSSYPTSKPVGFIISFNISVDGRVLHISQERLNAAKIVFSDVSFTSWLITIFLEDASGRLFKF